MIKDHRAASNEQLNLSKGIMISGPIGCGKTFYYAFNSNLFKSFV